MDSDRIAPGGGNVRTEVASTRQPAAGAQPLPIGMAAWRAASMADARVARDVGRGQPQWARPPLPAPAPASVPLPLPAPPVPPDSVALAGRREAALTRGPGGYAALNAYAFELHLRATEAPVAGGRSLAVLAAAIYRLVVLDLLGPARADWPAWAGGARAELVEAACSAFSQLADAADLAALYAAFLAEVARARAHLPDAGAPRTWLALAYHLKEAGDPDAAALAASRAAHDLACVLLQPSLPQPRPAAPGAPWPDPLAREPSYAATGRDLRRCIGLLAALRGRPGAAAGRGGEVGLDVGTLLRLDRVLEQIGQPTAASREVRERAARSLRALLAAPP